MLCLYLQLILTLFCHLQIKNTRLILVPFKVSLPDIQKSLNSITHNFHPVGQTTHTIFILYFIP